MTDQVNQYDIIPKLIPHLDAHLILPILKFLIETKAYDVNVLQKQKLAILSKTKMIDATVEEYNKINGENAEYTAQMQQKKEEIVKQIASVKESIGAALAQTLTFEVIDSSVANTLCTHQQLTALFEYATLLQDVGHYADALKAFTLFTLCVTSDHENYAKALWARLHCVLLVSPPNTLDVVKLLRENIDTCHFPSLAIAIQNRVWFATWILFLTPNFPQVRSMIVDFLGNQSGPQSNDRNDRDRFTNAIVSSAPHLLRYVTAFVIMSSRQSTNTQATGLAALQLRNSRSNHLKELVKILSAERKNLNDPFVDFILALHVDFDFKSAVDALHRIVPVIERDFFLHHHSIQADFFNSAKALLVDAYVRLHTNITKQSISEALPLQLPFTDNTINLPEEGAPLVSPSLSKPPFHKSIVSKLQRISK